MKALRIERRSTRPRAGLRLSCAFAVFAGAACARDTGHLLRAADVVEEMRQDGSVADITFVFGAASAANGVGIRVEGKGRPYGPRGDPLPDDELTCRKALRDALGLLAHNARGSDKHAVVGIVSDSFDREFDSAQQVECHSGMTHSVVVLKGTLVDAAPAALPALAPPVAAFMELPFSNPTPMAHGRVVPPATGFAASGDVDAVPTKSEQRDRYREYLALRSPKAFAIDELGNGRHVEHARDAMARVLDRCAQEHLRCWLYAVDDRIVWNADIEQRAGLSSQLRDNRLLKPSMTPPGTPPRPRP